MASSHDATSPCNLLQGLVTGTSTIVCANLHSEQYPVEHWICEILTSDLVCITMASNFRDDHILDKITIMYTYASRSPQ